MSTAKDEANADDLRTRQEELGTPDPKQSEETGGHEPAASGVQSNRNRPTQPAGPVTPSTQPSPSPPAPVANPSGPSPSLPPASADGTRPRIVGLNDPRKVVPPQSGLEEPRVPPWREWLTSQRAFLVDQAAEYSTVAAPPADIGASDNVTTFVYRYTRGPYLVNEDMNYGERIEELFWYTRKGDNKALPHTRISQITKTGRQLLNETPEAPHTPTIPPATLNSAGAAAAIAAASTSAEHSISIQNGAVDPDKSQT